MKLIYRGTTYDHSPDQAPSCPLQQVYAPGSAYNLTYRGINYHVKPNTLPTTVPLLAASHKLIYRGITYFINQTANGRVTLVSQRTNTPNVAAKAFPHQALSN